LLGLLKELIYSARGQMSPSYKTATGNLAADSRRAIMGIMTSDVALFLHAPVDLKDLDKRNAFRHNVITLLSHLPADDLARARTLKTMDRDFKAGGMIIERTAFFLVAAIEKMEQVCDVALSYPKENTISRLATNLVTANLPDLATTLEGNSACLIDWLLHRLPATRQFNPHPYPRKLFPD